MRSKKDLRPDTSYYVMQNLSDPSRASDPAFLKLFPFHIHKVFAKQPQYRYKPSKSSDARKGAEPGAKDRRSGSAKKRKSVETTDGQVTETNAEQTRSQDSAQKNDLRIVKKDAQNNLQNNMSAMPSDFEHIFHYSDTS